MLELALSVAYQTETVGLLIGLKAAQGEEGVPCVFEVRFRIYGMAAEPAGVIPK